MTYGIDNAVLEAPYSLLISIVLFFGIVFIGDIFQKSFLKNINSYDFIKYNFCFSPLIGVYLIIFPLYLILIFEFYFIFFIKLISYCLFFFGLISIFLYKNSYTGIINFLKRNQSLEDKIIILLFLLLFLISASPITHADALDYHFYGALNFLNYGHFQKEILPMHSILASVGEIPIALGLVLGAEQFGGILQFSSLISLIPIFYGKKNFFLLAILACPITFFLVSSPKPQLIFSITSLLIFIFLINHFYKLKIKEIRIFYFITPILFSLSYLSKFSFILSSSLLFIFSYIISCKKKIFFTPLIISFIIFGITILPHWIFRYINFDTGLFHILSSPLPINIYGFDKIHDLLSGGSIDLVSVFFLKNIKDFSTTFGPLFLILILMINRETIKFKIPLILFLITFMLILIFGSNLNRFLYESYLWLIFLISITFNKKSLIYNFFSKTLILQSFLISFIYLFYIVNLFPGSLNSNYKKDNVMIDNANGYELATWVNQNLKPEDILLSTHRSISLFKMKTYSNIFTWFIDIKNNKSLIYGNFLKTKKINRVVFYGNELDTEIYDKCLGKLLFYKKNVGKHVGRNPLTRKEYYDGWIYEFKSENLPNCLN